MEGEGIIINQVVAAAAALVGVDLLANNRKRTSSRRRLITGFRIVGGNAINEATITIGAGDYNFGNYQNSHAGAVAPLTPDDLQPVRPTWVMPGDAVSMLVAVAPTVSPITVQAVGLEY